MALAPDQVTRYARHLLLAEVGRAGQERLLAARVRLAGTGRATEEAATYLAAAGVGTLVLDPALADRLAPRLRALNDDTDVRADGPADVTLEAPAPDTRLTGALAALGLLVALSGAGPEEAWRAEGREIRWHHG